MRNDAGAAAVWRHLVEVVRPPRKDPPSEWAQRCIVLTEGERTGPIRLDRGYEFQREIVDVLFGAFRPGETRRVGVVNKGAQSGITTWMLIGLLYRALVHDTSGAHMMPREWDAIDKAKKLDALIEASPELARHFYDDAIRARKTSTGQTVRVIYSNSKSELKSFQSGVNVTDEPDDCESRAFDSISMFGHRLGAYRRVIQLFIGTPTLPDYGITKRWEASDKRLWYVRCPLCDAEQTLTWDGNIAFTETAEDGARLPDADIVASARIVCSACREPWDYRLRELANASGVWRATQKSDVIGFGMNRIMVPTSSAEQMVENYLAGEANDIAMKEHYNQDRGESYLRVSGRLDESRVKLVVDPTLRWGVVPRGTVYLAAGVDVQGDAEPFSFVWELRAYDGEGAASVIAYGVDNEARILELFGARGSPGLYSPAAVLLDISDGHHKAAVTRITDASAIASAVRCDWHRKTSFKRGEVVKIKRGAKGYAIDEDSALELNMGRFFADVPRIRFAVAPRPGLTDTLVEHYTKIARVPEATAAGPVVRYQKLRPRDVDFPYAGAFADYAYAELRGTSFSGAGGGGYGPVDKVRQSAAARGTREAARKALHVARRKR